MDKMELIKYGSVSLFPNLVTNSYYSTSIVVVGCGGTGGRLIPGLAQHIANHNRVIESNPINRQYIKHKMSLTIFDGDIVENKNLKRQNFHSFDVGKNKAEVLAKRFSALYGMDISYSTEFLSAEDITAAQRARGDNLIVFDCTDNLNARKLIEEQFMGNHRRIIISCGNEDTFGQILVSSDRGYTASGVHKYRELLTNIAELNRAIQDPKITYKKSFHYLPTLLELYKNFKDTPTASCTDMALQDEQSMPINALVAQLAYNAFYNLVAGNNLIYNIVKCNVDNIYDTRFINHPIELRNVYLQALFGDSSPLGLAAIQGAISKGMDTNLGYSLSYIDYNVALEFLNQYGKYSIPFIKAYMEIKYNLSKDQIASFNNAIVELERQDANI